MGVLQIQSAGALGCEAGLADRGEEDSKVMLDTASLLRHRLREEPLPSCPGSPSEKLVTALS